MAEITAEAEAAAPRERVWALLTATASWADWAPFETAEVAAPGPTEPRSGTTTRS